MELIDAWDDTSTLGKKKNAVTHSHSNGHSNSHSNGYDANSTLSTTLPTYENQDSVFNSPEFVECETYSEIAVPAGVTSSRAVSNQGYIFEDDLHDDTKLRNTNNSRPLQLGSSRVLAGSLDHRCVSDLYSKPMKGKRKQVLSTSSLSSGGFDDPGIGVSIYESAHEHDDQDIYGYSTSLA